MAPTVIVAIPAEDDYVNKISSEKVAHMTMLFLGDLDAAEAQHVTEYLEHTADTSLRRFGLQVDRRGKLGPDEADVVFFDGTYGFLDEIKQARSHLLKDPVIKRAYDAVEQYPEWTPHLTLGYPAAPAHEDTRDYPGVHWIHFDRIALWTGDFEGFEVPLKKEGDALAMSDQIEEFLAHHGVKGMQWGVRRQKPSAKGTPATPTKPAPKKATAPEGKPTKDKAGRITSAPGPKKPASKTHHEMSDDELRQTISRINMERQYSQLTAKKPTGADAAKKFAVDLLLDVGKQQLKTVITSAATSQVNKQLAKRGLPVAKSKKNK